MQPTLPPGFCSTLLCCQIDADGAAPAVAGMALRCEHLRHVEQLFDRWRSISEVVCLFSRCCSDELMDVIGRIRLKLPAAPLLVVLSETGSQDINLIGAGVQDYVCIPSAEEFTRRCDQAVARMHYEQTLRRLSHFDPLTGLANRGLFQDRLEQSLMQARRNSVNVGLLFIDVDRFRVLNDIYGHPLGDKLLVACAQRLMANLRRSDTVARLGGNSFAVILDGVRGINIITTVAEKLSNALKLPFRIDDNEIFITVSVGVDISCEANYDPAQMVRRAELALHQAKRDGRNACQVYTAQVAPMDKIRVGLESALHHAMERDELRLAYQPQVSVVGEQFVGVEVLLRWQHPVLGLVAPNVFIPVLEDTGLIEPFGEWVLRQACKQYRQWLDSGVVAANSKISVNLSPRQFRQRDLGQRIRDAIAETGLPPSNLTLEITESTLMYNLEQGAAMLSELRHMGVSVAIDDFGTGYSSLAYLKDLPIDYLKIDRSFVKDIVTDANDAAIANSIIALAHNLGLKVVAEGVEEQEILDRLAGFGCDQYQGYFFARPVSADEIPTLVKRCA
jgi:diguanylate cyclase (GGDEF)-like protein